MRALSVQARLEIYEVAHSRAGRVATTVQLPVDLKLQLP